MLSGADKVGSISFLQEFVAPSILMYLCPDSGGITTTTPTRTQPKTTTSSTAAATDKSTPTRVVTTTGKRNHTTTTKVPLNSPPGGVNVISPGLTDGPFVYPIGTRITWSYNYTSLIISPTAINVEAFCSWTNYYYTIAQNYSMAERTVVWDTGEYQKTGNPAIAQ